jgi:uncharacterized cupredoxin-like copper-binding protein
VYLVGIALVALAVGVAALAFARGEMAASATPMAMPAAMTSARMVDRTISLSTTDTLRFAPDSFTVRAGETVAFEITNLGSVPHEFVIGDASEQLAHEREMASGAMAAEPNAVDVAAGQTARLVYTFSQPGSVEIACHVAGHYAAGMRGTITVIAV